MHLFLLFIRIFVIFTVRVNWSQSRGVIGWRQWRARQCIRGLTQKDTYFQSHTRRLFRLLSLWIWTVRGKWNTKRNLLNNSMLTLWGTQIWHRSHIDFPPWEASVLTSGLLPYHARYTIEKKKTLTATVCLSRYAGSIGALPDGISRVRFSNVWNPDARLQ